MKSFSKYCKAPKYYVHDCLNFFSLYALDNIHVSLRVKSFPMIEKSFGIIKMIKLLEFQGPWAELHVQVCSVGVLGGVVGAGECSRAGLDRDRKL